MHYNDTPASTRAEAIKRNEKHYFTGKPCSRGHLSQRHLTGTCVDCQQIANRAWAERNPGEGLRRARKWQKLNPDRARDNSRRSWRKRNQLPNATRPVPENCECCSRKLEGGKKTHLDHCHETGRFRGWICNRCNLGIGSLGDTVAGVERAIQYLLAADFAD